ncbi:DUF4065 domain-containing protein [Stappia sp. BW2]|nr:DUF4065 domain-containing protein [Stappia sp. BW2]
MVVRWVQNHECILMTYDARAVANFFLSQADERDMGLTPMTLLKIMYFAHAWYLVKYDKPLVGQPFEAWKHGPVSRVVYDEVKQYGSAVVSEKLKKFDPRKLEFAYANDSFSMEEEQLLIDVFRYYAQFHAYQLSDLTHEVNSPWDKVWKEAETKAVPGMFISNDMIKEWFSVPGGRLKVVPD